MYQKIKITLCIGIFIIGTFGLYAQTDTIVSNITNTKQGEIVISKAELISFLEKIAEARKEKLEDDLENSNLQYSRNTFGARAVNQYSTAPAAIVPLSTNVPLQSMSRDDLLREIETLNSRLNYMYGYGGGGGNSTTFLTTPGNSQGGGYYPYQTQSPLISGVPSIAPTSDNSELRWKIDSLQRQLNMLSEPAVAIEKKDEILRLNREIGQVQDSLIASSTLTPEAKEIVKRYGTSQMQVFFDNDVYDVSPRYHEEVERAATLLKKNLQLGVVLKGFASPVGNAKYNYDLSMRRNESVKRMLIDYGVFPDQISSVFYGEDKTSSADNARRVNIEFIIK